VSAFREKRAGRSAAMGANRLVKALLADPASDDSMHALVEAAGS
jgi:hypothetical protein